jgi:hypothetical protein
MLKVVKEMFCQHSPTPTEHKTETSEGKFLLMDSSLPWKKGPAEARKVWRYWVCKRGVITAVRKG